jgi:NAD(P)-dependent dehydrogenase (short-subunit alcohol dehydrogenase family)
MDEHVTYGGPDELQLSGCIPILPQVVVTGSSKGLGYALAHAFLQAGDSVVVNSRDAKRCEDAVSRLNEDFPAASVCCFAADVGIAEQVLNLHPSPRACRCGIAFATSCFANNTPVSLL